ARWGDEEPRAVGGGGEELREARRAGDEDPLHDEVGRADGNRDVRVLVGPRRRRHDHDADDDRVRARLVAAGGEGAHAVPVAFVLRRFVVVVDGQAVVYNGDDGVGEGGA